MNPREYRYTKEHEWVCPVGEARGKMGITDYAQSQLGDIVYLDLPEPGTEVRQFEKVGEIESVKAVSDLFAPVSGWVVEVNQEAIEAPQLVNQDPYGAGWLVRLELSQALELDALMSAKEYDEFVAQLSQGGEFRGR